MRVLEPAPATAAPGVAAPAAAARHRAPAALFAVLLVVGVLPIWLVAHVPTQDGGNHVESVLALLALPRSPLLQRVYLPNYGPQPNWLTQLLFAGLAQLMAPRLAEKLVLTGYLLLLPLAFRWALPRGRRDGWAALGIFPFLHSYPFHMGFWNFCYSLVGFFLIMGYWERTRGRLGLRRGVGLAALGVGVFYAHSVSTSSAMAALAALLLWRGGLALHRARGRPARRRRVLRGYALRAAATAAALAPTAALTALFMVRQPKPLAYRPALVDYLKHLATLYTLVSYSRWELALGAAVAAVLAAAVVLGLRARARRRLRLADGWLAAAAAGVALYLAMPDAVADGAQLSDRLMLYPVFAVLLWLGAARPPPAVARAAALALAGLFLCATGVRVASYRALDGYLAEYASVAPQVARGSVILPLTLSPFGPRSGHTVDGPKPLAYRVQPFTHAAGWIAAERGAVELDNSQANTHHAPLRWRPAVNPFTLLQTRPFGLEAEPPCAELWVYPALVGRIDYVLLWGDRTAAAGDACGAALLAELRRDWVPVFASAPRGLAELWVPRPAAASR